MSKPRTQCTSLEIEQEENSTENPIIDFNTSFDDLNCINNYENDEWMSQIDSQELNEGTNDNDSGASIIEDIEVVHANTFVAKDGTVWDKTPLYITSYPTLSYISINQSGPHQSTATLSIRDTFKCIFSNKMIDIIIRHINTKVKQQYEKYHEYNAVERQLWQDLTVREIDSFLGILITSGINNSKLDDEQTMWKSNSHPLYRASMNMTRFTNILRFIAFDNANTQAERVKEIDISALIRDLWNMLHSNLQRYYSPTNNLTIGEQLVPYPNDNLMHISSLKIWWLCDAKNYYPLFGQFQTRILNKETLPIQKINQDRIFIKRLIDPYKGSGRNITMDHFTTLPLAEDLLSLQLTIVGALDKNETYIPREMAPSDLRKESFTVFGFRKNTTICSHMPKEGSALILLSTIPNRQQFLTTFEDKETPDIVDFYNKTKFGHRMHKMLEQYSTLRRTDNWSAIFFYNILDIAAFAAYIIYTENNIEQQLEEKANKQDVTRRKFLRKLGEELCMPMIQDRSQDPQIIRDFSSRTGIECMLQRSVNVIDETSLASTSTTLLTE